MGIADPRRSIPRTDVLLDDERLREPRRRLGDLVVKRAVRSVQQRMRSGRLAVSNVDDVIDEVIRGLPVAACGLQPVLNATGVILHTNLGRAPLSRAAVNALTTASGYVDVEFDLATGARARRGRSALAALLARTSGAEDALVVNNGAGALVLAATALAQDREVIVSRGEMVEIGDGFRIPELLRSTGARLVEVGTTNRTHLADYASAIGPETAFILKIHPSNFSVHGFTSGVGVAELATLQVPIVGDIGSGLLEPEPAVPDEPDARTWLRQGASMVTASGDKLLGGPQAGLILGDAELVGRMRRHPLQRALRVDKLILAALEATLLYPTTPVRDALHVEPEVLRDRADRLAAALLGRGIAATVVSSAGLVGGGGAPDLRLPSWAVQIAGGYAELLRVGVPAVVARVERGSCLLDLRCVPAAEDERLVEAVSRAADAASTNDAPGSEPPCT